MFKKFCHHNTVLRSKKEVSRGSTLFIFYVLKYGEKRRVPHSPSMAVRTISKAVWQTRILAVCISHWVGASLVRTGCDEMRVRNELARYHGAWMNSNSSSQITSGFSRLFLCWFANTEALFKKPQVLWVHDRIGQPNIRFNDKKFWLEVFFPLLVQN